MATREVYEWSKTDASNNFPADEGGWAEGMLRSNVNDAARADMGAIRRWYDDPEWLNLTNDGTITRISATQLDVIGQDATAYFTAGRRVKITGGTPTPVYATVVSSAFGDPDTQVTLVEFDGHTGVPTTPVLAELHITSQVTSSIFLTDIFRRVTTLTSAAIQEAIDAAEADGGGIIVLEPQATYIMSETVNIGLGASEGNVRIMGRGATLQAAAALDGLFMFDIADTADAVVDVNLIMEDIIFDGNSAALTASSAGIALVSIGANTSNVWIRNSGFNDSYGDCIGILDGCHKIWITDCLFKDMGEDGIYMTDSANTIDQIYISRCSFDTPANTAAITQGAGIHFAGKAHISDCSFVNYDHGSNVQIGIHGRVKNGTSPNDQSGRESTIIGCRFEGTGLNARGVYLQGRDCMVIGCQFNLSGAGTEGVQVEYSGNESERHVITGCNFIGMNRGVRLETSAQDCVVQGCIFDGVAFPYTDDGVRNKFISNNMEGGTDGVTISSGSDDAHVANNTIENFSSDGIAVAAGADRAQLLHNLTTAITTLHVNDAGNQTGQIGGHRGYYVEHTLGISTGALSLTTTEQLISDGAGSDLLETIGAYADGKRVWVVESAMVSGEWENDSNIDPVIISLWHGTNSGGTIASDTTICSGLITLTGTAGAGGVEVRAGDPWQCVLPQAEFTPASGDDVYMSISTLSGTLGLEVMGTSDARYSLFRVRPK